MMAADHAVVEVGGRAHRVSLGPTDGERLQIALDDETYFARVVRWGDELSVSTPAGRHALTLVDPFHYEPADLLPDARLTAELRRPLALELGHRVGQEPQARAPQAVRQVLHAGDLFGARIEGTGHIRER